MTRAFLISPSTADFIFLQKSFSDSFRYNNQQDQFPQWPPPLLILNSTATKMHLLQKESPWILSDLQTPMESMKQKKDAEEHVRKVEGSNDIKHRACFTFSYMLCS